MALLQSSDLSRAIHFDVYRNLIGEGHSIILPSSPCAVTHNSLPSLSSRDQDEIVDYVEGSSKQSQIKWNGPLRDSCVTAESVAKLKYQFF